LNFEDSSFDVVLMGFGVPSYTNHRLSIPEAWRVLKPGGVIILTVYNTEALFFEVQKEGSMLKREIPVAAEIVKTRAGRDKLRIGGSFECDVETFSADEIHKYVKSAGFEVKEIRSFPTLYTALPKSMTKRREGEEPIRMGIPLLDELFHNEDSSLRVHELDVQISKILKYKGYYLTLIAEKPL